MTKKKFKCTLKGHDTTIFRDIFSRKGLEQCDNCMFLYTHHGKHWTEDVARCTAPYGTKYGDKFEYTASKLKHIKTKSNTKDPTNKNE